MKYSRISTLKFPGGPGRGLGKTGLMHEAGGSPTPGPSAVGLEPGVGAACGGGGRRGRGAGGRVSVHYPAAVAAAVGGACSGFRGFRGSEGRLLTQAPEGSWRGELAGGGQSFGSQPSQECACAVFRDAHSSPDSSLSFPVYARKEADQTIPSFSSRGLSTGGGEKTFLP